MISTPMISADQLHHNGVCRRWRAKLYRMFGPEIPVTLGTCLEHVEDINWDEATYLLHGEYRAIYLHRCSAILAEHESVSFHARTKLQREMSRVSDLVASIRTVASGMGLLVSDLRRANLKASYVYDIGVSAAVAEFRRDTADSLMRFKIRTATSFCAAYTAQWSSGGAT